MPASHVTVTRAEAGQKLVRFLERRLPGIPRSAMMRWIRTGQVRLDGKRCKPFAIVREGQDVRIPPHGEGESASTKPTAPTNGTASLDIIHKDQDLLVVNKPAGLPVQPGTGHDDSVVTRLRGMFAREVFVPAPAHRLDRDTTGVLLVGASHAALKQLSQGFAQGRIHKTYLAWVQDSWPHSHEILLQDSLQKQGVPGRERVATGSGKTALAKVRPAGTSGKTKQPADVPPPPLPATLLQIQLLTGRTHQIRVQLSSRGFPLLGDGKYDGPTDYPDKQGLLLHAWRVDLPDGRTITATPPWKGRWNALPYLD